MRFNELKLKVLGQENIAGEVWGGAASMLVALTSSIAFGLTAYGPLGAGYVAQGAMAGMMGVVALGLLAPIFGGTPRLITAPCAPAAMVLADFVSKMIEGKEGAAIPPTPQHALLLMTLAVLMCGGLQFLYGVVGGGRLIKYIPFPVVSGYLSGVGILIFIKQVPLLFGIDKKHVWEGLMAPEHWKWPGLVVGGVTIAGMLFASRVTKLVPPSILGLSSGVLTYLGLSLVYPELGQLKDNKLLIGVIEEGAGFWAGFVDRWTALGGLRLGDLRGLFMPALTLSLILSIDTLKTCVVMDALTRTRHNSNRELLGQGIGNVASSLMGGMPGAGTMGATLVNWNSGGKTRLSSFLEGVFALIAFLLFSKWIGWVPVAALAGILMVVAFRMIDRSSFHLLKQKATVLDFCVILAVVIMAVTRDLISAAGLGLGLAILLFIRELIRGSVIRRKVYGNQISSKRHRLPEEKEVLHEHGTLITVADLQGSLFFGTTDQLFTKLESDLKTSRYVILNMRHIQSVDFTAAHMLEQIEAMLADRNGFLIFCCLPETVPTKQDLRAYFNQLGLIRPTQNVKVFDGLDAALEWAEERILEEQRLHQNHNEKPLALPEIDLLRGFESDGIMGTLKSCAVERSFAPDQTIFKKGDSGDELFLIRRGIVRILLPLGGGKAYNIATFARGNFFGDMAFLDRSVRSADAVAVTDTELFVISREDFDRMTKDCPLFGVKIFARLARALAIRLRHTDSELRSLQEA